MRLIKIRKRNKNLFNFICFVNLFSNFNVLLLDFPSITKSNRPTVKIYLSASSFWDL